MNRRPRALILAVAVLVAALTSPAVTHAAGPAVPAAIPLTTGWQYLPDPSDRGISENLPSGTTGTGWQDVTVPHLFDDHPDESRFYGTVGWFRLRFRGPSIPPGFAWAFKFEQVRRVTHAWLNGRDIGTNSDPYVPFMLPAKQVKPGQMNTLVMRVDNRKGKEPREGWWNWGGITRPVSLVPLGPLQLQSPGLMPQVRCPEGGGSCTASVLFDGTVLNRGTGPAQAPSITVSLTPPGGGTPVTATERVRSLKPGEQARVRFTIPIDQPTLWSPDNPDLYGATITTADGDTQAQIDRMRIGLREVQVRNGMLELNGRQLTLRGAAIQEDIDGHGPALSDADIDRIVAELKAVHANVTRAHYLLNERLLDKLDENGILVWSQAPIYHRDRLLMTPAERARAIATLRGTVLAARSHPSILTHSVANELSAVPDTVKGTRDYLDEAYRTVKDLDPTLPVSVDLLSYPGYGRQNAYAQYDLLGINSYFGWYPGKKNHSTAKLSSLGPYLDNMRRMYPTQALVLTEFGAESTFNGPAAEKETYAFQSRYVRDVLNIVEARPFVGGAIYWTLREFAVKPNWDGGAGRKGVARDGIHHKGLITYAGRRKPAWQVAEDDFASTPLYRAVTPAAAANLPEGRGGGSPVLLLAIALLVAGLLALDAWALAGILRARRRRSEEPAGAANAAAAADAAARARAA